MKPLQWEGRSPLRCCCYFACSCSLVGGLHCGDKPCVTLWSNASDLVIVPESNPHRTGTDRAVAEGYLIATKVLLQAPNEHNVFVYDIFHTAARMAVIQTSKAFRALCSFVDYLLGYGRERHNVTPSECLSSTLFPPGSRNHDAVSRNRK